MFGMAVLLRKQKRWRGRRLPGGFGWRPSRSAALRQQRCTTLCIYLCMHLLAPACEAIAGTTRKLEKTRIVADYLRSRSPEEAAASCVFLSGRAFPAFEEATLQVGGTQLWNVIRELSGKGDAALTAAYRKHGDLGSAACDVLAGAGFHSQQSAARDPNVLEVAESFRAIAAARGPAAKSAMVRALLARCTPLETKYLVKIITGELRIGMKESLVEDAIARAWGSSSREVQRANMLLGDIGETCRLAIAGRLTEARMRLFHPVGFMLAAPAESAQQAFEFFEHAAVEDKYDGIRAQAHCIRGEARVFSRTFDEVTGSFPEVAQALAQFDGEMILDGEIVAWSGRTPAEGEAAAGHALPFSELQKRLGRKVVTDAMMRAVPVAYVVFDVLYADGELVIDQPLRQRSLLLDAIFLRARRPALVRAADPQGRLLFEPALAVTNQFVASVIRAPVLRADAAAQLEEFFGAAQARGNEGLMIKDRESAYTPGRRGQSWLKLKRELATLDVVVTGVEFGHGKRAGVLSDYTFAVREDGRFVNIGKAYSGLTDKEIAGMTEWFLAHTLADRGFSRLVEPRIVLEVAFNAIMKSQRHESGYALRFPRIVRIRDDKPADEVDTIERVRQIYARQHGRSAETR
jgi:DNA ligase 1